MERSARAQDGETALLSVERSTHEIALIFVSDQGHGNATTLVVCSEPQLCRMFARILDRTGRVIATSTVEEADKILSREVVTHLLVDSYLGSYEGLGFELVKKWRCRHSSIRRAVVLSDFETPWLAIPDSVDHVIPKGLPNTEILRALFHREVSSRDFEPASNVAVGAAAKGGERRHYAVSSPISLRSRSPQFSNE